MKKVSYDEDEKMDVSGYFEKHYLIKKFGAEIMNQPAKDVEAISIIEEITDAYEVYKMRETNYKISQQRGMKKWH